MGTIRGNELAVDYIACIWQRPGSGVSLGRDVYRRE
jgi:hypothetical protein